LRETIDPEGAEDEILGRFAAGRRQMRLKQDKAG
jgi:hypothetical protein